MKLIIAGSRTITDYGLLEFCMNFFKLYPDEIVSGNAKGVDSLGERYAKENNIPLSIFKPDWDGKAGRGAGMVRNKEMLKYGDAVLLIWDGESKGSKFMKDNAEKFGCQLYEYIKLV